MPYDYDALEQLAEARDKGDYSALVGLEKTLAAGNPIILAP
ncbi:hypothetical protein [Micromonospora sp. NPDC047074]